MAETFRLDERRIGESAVIAAFGTLTEQDCGKLAAAIRKAGDGGAARVVLELDGLAYMSSAALTQMLAEHIHLSQAGRRLLLVCTNGRIRSMLAMSGVDRVLGAFENTEEALSAPTEADGRRPSGSERRRLERS